MPEYVECKYEDRLIYSAHPVSYPDKAAEFAKLLQQENGWCFLPIPIVDCGSYFQAVDGTHRLEAARQTGRKPEVIIINASIHPDQPIPEEYEWKTNSSLALNRIISIYTNYFNGKNTAIMLDDRREILRLEYVKFLFDFIAELGSQVPLLPEEKQNG